jgi:hypothetical protein
MVNFVYSFKKEFNKEGKYLKLINELFQIEIIDLL